MTRSSTFGRYLADANKVLREESVQAINDLIIANLKQQDDPDEQQDDSGEERDNSDNRAAEVPHRDIVSAISGTYASPGVYYIEQHKLDAVEDLFTLRGWTVTPPDPTTDPNEAMWKFEE